jgi:hypothetical protein
MKILNVQNFCLNMHRGGDEKGFFFVIDCNRESPFEPGLIQRELKTPYSVKIELCFFLYYFMFHVIFYIYVFDECFSCNLV